MVYDVCMTMAAEHRISDERFRKARAILGEQQLVDLIAVSGTYVTVAMLLSLGEELPPEGRPLPFPESARWRRLMFPSASPCRTLVRLACIRREAG